MSSYGNCGCSPSYKLLCARQGTSCCNRAVQAAPTPCCEPHISIVKPGVCFRPTCSVAATYPDHFYIAFKNICDEEVPISLGSVFFFDQAAGFLNVHLFNGTSYEVSLVDPTKVGAVIQEDACVIVQALMSTSGDGTTRCLSGNFIAPADEETATIFILNGSGIPIGSTITFTAGGETGSYTVTAFISASGSIYAYTVLNSGAGLTPGTIVDGGTAGACTIPIEVQTDVDICDLSEAETADSLAACLNGSPRAFVPVGEGYSPIGLEDGTWGQARNSSTDCCVVTDGVVKYSGALCDEAQDTVVLRDTPGIDCFEEAYNAAAAAGSTLTANIDGIPIIVLSYDSGTRTLVTTPTGSGYVDPTEYPAGTQICLGECCDQCLNGPIVSQVYLEGEEVQPSLVAFNSGNLALPTTAGTQAEFLIGYNTADPGVVTVLNITNTYNDDLTPPTGKPLVTEPMVLRQKICNDHPSGCPQDVTITTNVELGFYALPLNARVQFDVKSYISTSQTLADDVTPNPNFNVASSARFSGSVYGPSTTNLNVASTELGFGGQTTTKTIPYAAGEFTDHMQIEHCNCGLQIVWLHLLVDAIETLSAGNFTVTLGLRRYVEKKIGNYGELVDNTYDQGWN